MLRSLGIPAREAVGYVPGSYNPITDLYDVQAKDAHAWVQVWFPGYGWQNFDPTADGPAGQPRRPGRCWPTTRRARSGPSPVGTDRLSVVLVGVAVEAARRRAEAPARRPGPTRWPPTSSVAGRGWASSGGPTRP